MNKSIFVLDDEDLVIKSVTYDSGELSIKTSNNYELNINIDMDISVLKTGVRENISKKIHADQNFITEKYSYVIDIGHDVYLTKNNDNYLLEISIQKVNILIPPFDNFNKKRIELGSNYDMLEIHKLYVKIFFNHSL